MGSLIWIDKIRLDGGTQTRPIDEVYMAELIEDWHAGRKAETPVEIVNERGKLWLWDGFHRVELYRRMGENQIPANVVPGTQRTAILNSCRANAKHGKRRTDEEKRGRVLMLLADVEWVQESNAWIAKTCQVSEPLVSKLRGQSLESTTRLAKASRTMAESLKDEAKIKEEEKQEDTPLTGQRLPVRTVAEAQASRTKFTDKRGKRTAMQTEKIIAANRARVKPRRIDLLEDLVLKLRAYFANETDQTKAELLGALDALGPNEKVGNGYEARPEKGMLT